MRIDELIDLVGEHAALRLGQQLGGCRLYISRRSDFDRVVAAVGEGAAEALRRRYAGDRVDAPPVTSISRRIARRRAAQLLRIGHSVRETSRRTGLPRRTVRRLARAEHTQPAAGEGGERE